METCYLYGVQRNLRSPLECKFQEGKDLSCPANCILVVRMMPCTQTSSVSWMNTCCGHRDICWKILSLKNCVGQQKTQLILNYYVTPVHFLLKYEKQEMQFLMKSSNFRSELKIEISTARTWSLLNRRWLGQVSIRLIFDSLDNLENFMNAADFLMTVFSTC